MLGSPYLWAICTLRLVLGAASPLDGTCSVNGNCENDFSSQLQAKIQPHKVKKPVNNPYHQEKQGQRSSMNCSKKQVLLIIDMQRDYSVAYSEKTYGYIRNPFLNASDPPIELVVNEIVENVIDASVDWDMIVFSQDWLVDATIAAIGRTPFENAFCIRYTEGAEPFQELLDAAAMKQERQIRFAKNQDDVFNTWEPNPTFAGHEVDAPAFPAIPEDYPDRGYDANNTWNGMSLDEVLASLGYEADNTELTIVGTIADMCVLTSTVHARSLGYPVQVYVPGINGGSDTADSEWFGCSEDMVPDPYVACCAPKTDAEDLPNNWMELVYKCQFAAGLANALAYMQMAGATPIYEPPTCGHRKTQSKNGTRKPAPNSQMTLVPTTLPSPLLVLYS